MSLLAPLFLLGGLAIALPVVFHLVRRSAREKVVFGSLMFLRPSPPTLTQRSRLEHILLLLLRCLVIAILALGFARPFFKKSAAALPPAAAGDRVVVLVDTSASMRREGLWPEALAAAQAALKRASAADRVAVMVFDDQVHSVVSFEEWTAMNISERAALAAEKLATLKPGWRSTRLANALIAAADLLEDTGKREPDASPLRIVLISDLQEGSRLEGLQGHDWPRGLEVVVEPVQAKRHTNAGLQWVSDANETARPDADPVVRIRVSNSADAAREQFQIRWAGDTGAAPLDAYVPPGQSRIMPAPKLPAVAASDRIVLTGDDDDFDNTAYVVQPKAEAVTVLYLGGESESDSSQALFYLERAFEDTRRQTVRIITGSASPSATNRLVIVSGALAPDRCAEVRQFATNGGTVLFVMNDAASSDTLGQLVGASETGVTEAAVANYSMFSQIDFEHPLFAPFADPRFGDFTKVRFWKHRHLPAGELSGARVIARFDDNDPAILEIPAVRGHVFVFTFSWRPADGQFALSSKFVPLIYSLLDQAGGLKTRFSQYRVGDAVDLSTLAANSGGVGLSIRKPGGEQVSLARGEPHFTQTDEPGIYEVFSYPSSVRFAVNLDPSESRTAPLSLDELERLGVPMKPAAMNAAQTAARQQALRDSELEARQKLWRWLILAALVLLMLETGLSGWLTRRPAARIEAAA